MDSNVTRDEPKSLASSWNSTLTDSYILARICIVA